MPREGREKFRAFPEGFPEIRSFAELLRFLLQKVKKRKRGAVRLAEEVGATPRTVRYWLDGSHIPPDKKIDLIAKALAEKLGTDDKERPNMTKVLSDLLKRA